MTRHLKFPGRGDGKQINRQIIPATDLPAFGSKHFSIPFDATGKSWVRFAVWDSAGNPAFVNAVWLKSPDGPDGGGHVCVAIRGDRNIGEPQGE
jgi:hypothetical protein